MYKAVPDKSASVRAVWMTALVKGIKFSLEVVALSFLLMSGVRLAEWAIAEPALKILVCTTEDLTLHDKCKFIDNLTYERLNEKRSA